MDHGQYSSQHAGALKHWRGLFNTAIELTKPGIIVGNLASVLGELGCPRTAAALLEPIQAVLGEDSSWRPAIARTLQELRGQAQAGAGFCAALYPEAPYPD